MTFAIKSMTGFGRARGDTPVGVFAVELRAVNNRFHDVSVALPRDLSALEAPLRTELKRHTARGKLDCRVQFTPTAENQIDVRVNVALARRYAERLGELSEWTDGGGLSLDRLSALPGVVETTPAAMDEDAVWTALRGVVDEAAQALVTEQTREGRALAEHVHVLAAQLRELVAGVDALKDRVVEAYRTRLTDRIARLQAKQQIDTDTGRLEMEVALFADKCDIGEELVRLGAHLERLDQLLLNEAREPVGKSLDFLVQEFVREINTICSKARETDVLALGLDMKSTVEKIREQVQNIQ